MGVCPQDNILWGNLTAYEHLLFFGRLKGLKGSELHSEIYRVLKQVNLHETGMKKSDEFSGGMKRRLSVANALIGRPSVVLLDEPATGLDPASRCALWNVINEYKETCTILLTTHDMSEAEELCDRVAIMEEGALMAIGTVAELKTRYSKGFSLTFACKTSVEEKKAQKFIEKTWKHSKLEASLAGTSTYRLSKKDNPEEVFQVIFENKAMLNIIDWGLSACDLEHVFIQVLKEN
eukprot:TRINITY_DN1890_c0_g1_i1.p1 TRINITY_DN1890_c0_g1~~TRINITY_DN1890_c0_g1_i1.p1  ORF type:complete len:249 (+),score=42.04 TRINITY_DN1890_c0_g1_i1:44-748(+)